MAPRLFARKHQGPALFARCRITDPTGKPLAEVPSDGPVGDLLRAQGRQPYRPAHLHFLGYKPGYKTLITQIFVDNDEHLYADVVFGVTRHLIGGYRRGDGTPPNSHVKRLISAELQLRDQNRRGNIAAAANK
jgi:protocatechuate 3,4-dioxygenase beta subunit